MKGDVYKLHHRKSSGRQLDRLKKYAIVFIILSQETKVELFVEGIGGQQGKSNAFFTEMKIPVPWENTQMRIS